MPKALWYGGSAGAGAILSPGPPPPRDVPLATSPLVSRRRRDRLLLLCFDVACPACVGIGIENCVMCTVRRSAYARGHAAP
eukprot:2463157-Prymnesium_polylepis.1